MKETTNHTEGQARTGPARYVVSEGLGTPGWYRQVTADQHTRYPTVQIAISTALEELGSERKETMV